MKIIGVAMSMAVSVWVFSLVFAQNEKGWVGATFDADKCLKIQVGEFEVRRKLCNIKYVITRQNERFKIDGYLVFNKKFVPTRPKRIELEVLFMDDQYICRRQVNLKKQVELIPVRFSTEAETIPDPQYIRTYYTLFYP